MLERAIVLLALTASLHILKVEEPAVIVHRPPTDNAARHHTPRCPEAGDRRLALGLDAGTTRGIATLDTQKSGDRGVQLVHQRISGCSRA
jgi:hypothetical protein